MKEYIKPFLFAVDLRAEERFALTSPCTASGCCTDLQQEEMRKAGYIPLQ